MMGYAHMGAWLPMKAFCFLFMLGVVLFIVWAVRGMDKKTLKKWMLSLLIVGFVGALASSLFLMKDCDGKLGWKGLKGEKCDAVEEVVETVE
ncbi:MAG: hypothetical protein V1679_01460 [Candidatus Peregrinibacteria bacterium]